MRRFWIADFGFWIGRGEMREVPGGSAASTFHLKPAPKRRSAFTLIELLGVMAIIGILSAVVLPPLISKIEDANSVGEDANLEEIARALVAGIKATGTIPNPSLNPVLVPGNPPTWTPSGSWTAIAANYCSLIGYSLLNSRPADNQRQIVLSKGLADYVLANVNSYATDADGWPNPLPNDLKIYILASSKNGLPLQANIPVADIANWTKVFDATTGTVTVPESVFGAANTTRGEFLHVKVVDLNQLFCRVELREFPYPQSGTTQTGNPGGGYTAGTAYSANIGSFSFSFTAPSATFGAGTVASSIALNGTRSQITRNGATSTTMTGTIPAPALVTGGAAANFDITINNPPWWDISPPMPVNGQQMPNNANTQSFYVIKGTSLGLYTDGAALPSNPVLTVQINADTTFEYFNDSWTRVD